MHHTNEYKCVTRGFAQSLGVHMHMLENAFVCSYQVSMQPSHSDNYSIVTTCLTIYVIVYNLDITFD